MKFIQDKEINFNEIDLLNGKTYASSLKESILNTPTESSFTIGLFGEWGSGKSSIIKTVRTELEGIKDKKYKFIIYDAWKYSKDSFRRMFLLKIQEELNFSKTDLINSFYLNENKDVKINRKISTQKIIVIIGIFLIGLLSYFIIPSEGNEEWKYTLTLLFSFIGLLTAIFFKMFDEFKINIQKPYFFAAEQFEDRFNEMVSKSLKHTPVIIEKLQNISGNKHEKNIEKLIIVIDNIDRCNKELAYELLTNTKNFLGIKNNIIFIIPVDDESLKKHILSINSCNKEAEEFLRKFFNVTIRIKPFQTIEMYDFADKINKNNELGFNPTTIDIVSKEYATNPRRIIQLFNNLTTELYNFKINFGEKFVEENESIICKMLILREEWPDYYIAITKNLKLFYNDNIDEKNKFNDDNNYTKGQLKNFLNKTKAITKDIDIKLLEFILSNSKNFSDIPSNIITSINDLKINEIIEFIKDDQDKSDLVINYLIEELNKGVLRGSYKITVINTFSILLLLNKNKKFIISINHRIQNILDNPTVLNEFFTDINDLELIVLYISDLLEQNISYLFDYIIGIIDAILGHENPVNIDFWNNLLIKLISDLNDIKKIELLQEPFKHYIENNNILISNLNFPKERLKYLITNDLIKFIISKFDNKEKDIYNFPNLIFISKNYKISEDLIDEIFNKLNNIYSNFINLNKNQIFLIIVWVSALIKNLKISNKIKSFEIFNNKFFASMDFNPQILNFIRNTYRIPDEVEVILDYLTNAYIATNGSINNSTYFIEIVNANNRELVNKYLIILMNHRFSLNPLYNIILSDNNYLDTTFILLKYIFLFKTNNEYKLPETQLHQKISEICSLIVNNSDLKISACNFLENLLKDTRAKNIIKNNVSQFKPSEILQLTSKLQFLAFDKICEKDNIFNYENNLDLLKLIGSNGSINHISKLINVIVIKLQKESTYNEAFSILDSINEISNDDADKIIPLLNPIKKNDTYKDRISELIKKLRKFTS